MTDPRPAFRRAVSAGILTGWYGPHLQPGVEGSCYTLNLAEGRCQIKPVGEAIDYAEALEGSGLLAFKQ